MVGGLPSVGWANGSKALAAAMVVWCDEIFWICGSTGLFGIVPLPAHGVANSRARDIFETPTFYVGIEWYLRSVITKTIPLSL